MSRQSCPLYFLSAPAVYGNKVFQSSFIAILSPDATILVNLLWTLLNSGIALIGYWLAACVIDNARVGRLRLQLLGFFMVSPGPRLQHMSVVSPLAGTCTTPSPCGDPA